MRYELQWVCDIIYLDVRAIVTEGSKTSFGTGRMLAASLLTGFGMFGNEHPSGKGNGIGTLDKTRGYSRPGAG
jgi:hypothetical protein